MNHLTNHVLNKHYDTKNNVNVELPKENSTVIFKNFKNMLERPFVVYADFESSLIPTGLKDKTHKHVPNSASCYFVCTLDSSRNKLYEFETNNFVEDLVFKLKELSKNAS